MFKSEHSRKFAKTRERSSKNNQKTRKRNSKQDKETNKKIIEHLNRIKQFMNPKKDDVFNRLSQNKKPRTRGRNTIGGTRQNFLKHNRLTRVLTEHLKEKLFFPNNSTKILKLRTRHKTLCHRRKSPKTSTLMPKVDFNLDKSLLRKSFPDKRQSKVGLLKNLKMLLSSEHVGKSPENPATEREVEDSRGPVREAQADSGRAELVKKGSSFSTVQINIVNKDTPSESWKRLSKQNSHSELGKPRESVNIKKSGSMNDFKSKKFSATLIFSANRSEAQAKEANRLLENLFDAKAPNPKRTSLQIQNDHLEKIFKRPFQAATVPKKTYKTFNQT